MMLQRSGTGVLQAVNSFSFVLSVFPYEDINNVRQVGLFMLYLNVTPEPKIWDANLAF